MSGTARNAALLMIAALLPAAGTRAGGKAEATETDVAGAAWPVVLVPGIWDTPSVFNRLTARLEKEGWSAFAVPLKPNDGSVTLEQSADELKQLIDARLGPRRSLDMVAFSMGGLVARFYAQRLGGLARMRHLVTISTPHRGTRAAYLDPLPAVREMRPGSPFLQDLDRDAARLARVSVTSIWSPLDVLISPAVSSRLAFGSDVQIPVLLHFLMPGDERVIEAVVRGLRN
jgi:triacylglycerol lipase